MKWTSISSKVLSEFPFIFILIDTDVNIVKVGTLAEYRVEKKKLETKYRKCFFPISWSVHCNFVRDGNRLKTGLAQVGVHPPTLTSQG
jgi:hypothetical protein